jgi:putative FmdB family regulatory protein
MPIFEYFCRDCSKRFETLVQGSQTAVCPFCHGANLEQQLSVFAVGRRSQQAASSTAGSCGTCGDPRGPGSCSLG